MPGRKSSDKSTTTHRRNSIRFFDIYRLLARLLRPERVSTDSKSELTDQIGNPRTLKVDKLTKAFNSLIDQLTVEWLDLPDHIKFIGQFSTPEKPLTTINVQETINFIPAINLQ